MADKNEFYTEVFPMDEDDDPNLATNDQSKPGFDHGKAVRIGCLLIFLFFALLWGGCRATSFIKWSEGDREGKLIKMSYKGFPIGHYEGDLSMGALGRNNSSSDASMIFHFSVNDETVAKELEDMLGEEVILHYKQYMATGLVNDTEYVVTRVRRPKSTR